MYEWLSANKLTLNMTKTEFMLIALSRIKVYNSLIQPYFDYCNVVWGNCNKGLSEKLQRLQNRAARVLMSESYDSNLDDLFRALRWSRLYYQRLEQKAILMYKTLHGMTFSRDVFCTVELSCGTTYL